MLNNIATSGGMFTRKVWRGAASQPGHVTPERESQCMCDERPGKELPVVLRELL